MVLAGRVVFLFLKSNLSAILCRLLRQKKQTSLEYSLYEKY